MWIKICWGTSGALGLLVVFAIYLLFFTRQSQAGETLPDVEKKKEGVGNEKDTIRPLEYFADTWKVNFNTNPPPEVKTATVAPPNWLLQLLSRHVSIKQIITDDFAVVIVGGVEQLIEPRKESNKNDVVKRWQLTLEGKPIIISKIQPGKGVRFESSGQDVWLESKPVANQPARNQPVPNQPAANLEPNQDKDRLVVTPQEGEELAQHYDEYIQELSPEATDQGLKIRRMHDNSKARQYGLQVNDIINSINNVPLRSLSQIPDFIRKNQRQRQISVDIIRNGQKIKLTFQIR
jgi:hypothetical protein